ncbi:MAG TPA: hypothetical protein VFC31_02655 [Candidatus Limnocylindria bacterium]|nr:hypothetical protein [Candidatus Limnocylindria bacterium]
MGTGLDAFEQPLATLGQLLEERGQRFDLFAIGGGALQLIGLITRPTRGEPTRDELLAAAAWAATHDPSEGFRQELRGALRSLGVSDGGE